MKIKSNTLAILVIVILLGGIFASSAMNIWNTKCNSRVSYDRYANIGSGQENHGKGEYDEEYDFVKGRTTFQEVISLGVSKDKIEKIIGSSIPNSTMRIKDYCIDKGLDFHTVKEVLQEEVDKK